MSEDGEDIPGPTRKKPRLEGDTSTSGASVINPDPPDASQYNSWTKEEVLRFFALRNIDTEGRVFDLETLLQRMIRGKTCQPYIA